MSEELIERYKQLDQELVGLTDTLERVRVQRAQVVGQLWARDGKGKVYDLGDGLPRIICMTKVGTHYMVPQNKWAKPGRPQGEEPKVPKAVKEAKAPKAVKEAKAPKEPKAPKGAVKRAIVNGQVVEVPVEPKQAVLLAPEPVELERVDTSVAPEAPAPVVEVAPPTVEGSPPELSEKESLDAVLAALGLD